MDIAISFFGGWLVERPAMYGCAANSRRRRDRTEQPNPKKISRLLDIATLPDYLPPSLGKAIPYPFALRMGAAVGKLQCNATVAGRHALSVHCRRLLSTAAVSILAITTMMCMFFPSILEPRVGEFRLQMEKRRTRRGGSAAEGPHELQFTVTEGDTLASIAEMFGVTVGIITTANPNLRTDADLPLGGTIIVPLVYLPEVVPPPPPLVVNRELDLLFEQGWHPIETHVLDQFLILKVRTGAPGNRQDGLAIFDEAGPVMSYSNQTIRIDIGADFTGDEKPDAVFTDFGGGRGFLRFRLCSFQPAFWVLGYIDIKNVDGFEVADLDKDGIDEFIVRNDIYSSCAWIPHEAAPSFPLILAYRHGGLRDVTHHYPEHVRADMRSARDDLQYQIKVANGKDMWRMVTPAVQWLTDAALLDETEGAMREIRERVPPLVAQLLEARLPEIITAARSGAERISSRRRPAVGPNQLRHTVTADDTLLSIAQMYGVPVSVVSDPAVNPNLETDSDVIVGATVIVVFE